MQRVEFKTIVHNGIIELPKDGPQIMDEEVNVTLVWEDKNEKNFDETKILQVLSDIRNTKIFDAVDNPSEWQKKQRDDWE